MGRLISFKTNARHISQLGRELVTDFVTALVELVKNSYDADAHGVKVIFEDVKRPNGKLIIVDTGTGMTQDDIEEKWAVIGTNNKVRNTHSPKGRKYSGKKGIGRFAVERLADKVRLYSFSEKEEPFKFSVNWNRYEDINVQALKQRVSLLKHSNNDIESAKYIKSHLDYFLGNSSIKEEDKKHVINNVLENKELLYTLFLGNNTILNNIEKELIPILQKYQNEEIRISDVFNEIEEIDTDEKERYRVLLENFYEEIDIKDKKSVTGLIIVLEGLRDEWKQKDITKLQKELRVLVAPDFLESDPFKIKLVAPEFEIQSDVVMNSILDLHFAKIDAIIKDNGKTLQIFYKDKNGVERKPERTPDIPFICGDVEMELYFFLRDQENLSNEVFNVTHARNILDEFCGIKIYRDGFHVKPYGDAGNDWLLLDQRKVKDTHGYLVGNNQTIGIIKITEDNNPLLIDATNREGIIENEAYEHLKRFVWECTDFISNIRYEDYLKRELENDKIRKEEEKKKEDDERRRREEDERERLRKEQIEKNNNVLDKLLNKAKSKEAEELHNLTLQVQKKSEEEISFYKSRLDEERKRSQDHYEKTKKIYDETLQNKERELNLYKNLATLGILTGSFGHETKDIISRISADIEFTRMCYPEEIMQNDTDIVLAYEQITKDFNRIQGYSNLIVSFLKKDKREKDRYINFKTVIEDVSRLYARMLKAQNIDLYLDLQDFESEFKMFGIDLESVVINMITNSFEALKHSKNKKIHIISKAYDAYYELVFEDNGAGIKEGFEESIFLPFNTTKEDGIGLGLSIVKDIVTRYKGTINVNNSSIHGGAIFSIKFPRGE